MHKVKGEILNGKYDIIDKVQNISIQDFSDIFLEKREKLRSSKRDQLSVKTLLSYFKRKQLTSIKPLDIENYITKRAADGVANATINRELACLKTMFNLAIKWQYAKKNPVTGVNMLEEPPGRTRFLTIEEAQKLIHCCADHINPIVITALNTGMRLGEILNLTWDRVYINHVIDPYIEVTMTKNNKKRFIHLHEEMIMLLKKLKEKNPDSQNVFLSVHGKQLKSVRKPFHTALKKAGINDFRFHDLRHTFASHFIMNGGDLLTLKEILGHSSMKMAERYSHLAAAHKRRQITNIEGLFSDGHPMDTSTKIIKISTDNTK